MHRVVTKLGIVLVWILKSATYITKKFFKVILLIVVGSLLLSLISCIIASQFITPYVSLVAPTPVITGFIGYYAGIFTLFIIPALLIGKWMINFAFGYKSTFQFRKTMAAFWLVSFMTFIGTLAFSARNFSTRQEVKNEIVAAEINKEEILQINFKNTTIERNFAEVRLGHARLHDGKLYAHDIGLELKFSPSEEEQISIDKTVSSFGRNRSRAKKNGQYAQHELSYKENTIDFNSYYTIDKRDKFRVQELSYEVFVPIGTKVQFNYLNPHILTQEHKWSDEGNGLIMTKDGIKSIESKTKSE